MNVDLIISIFLNLLIFRKMYRSTTELDDEDTINEHRRYFLAKPDHAREKAVRIKMRATINIMNSTASRILNTETRICKDEKAVQSEHGSSRLIADMWQEIMKMIFDETIRTAAVISELEDYTNMLGAHARLVRQLSSTFEKLLNTRDAKIAKKPTMSILLDEQGENFLKLVIECHDEVKDKKLYWQSYKVRNNLPP